MTYVLALVVVVIVGLLVVASRKPETFSVSRSTVINAPSDRIFGLIDDFHQWASWSPFEKLDPAMNKTFSGPASGPGTSYAWTGNKKAGAGSMTISSSTPSLQVNIAMAFLKPFKSQSTVQFSIAPAASGVTAAGSSGGDAHEVTWTMGGKNQIFSKVMSVFMSMDKLIGKDFAEGLANLKRVAESSVG